MSRRSARAAGDEVKSRILLRRFGSPQEVAYAVWFLASRFADYITGQVLARRWRLQDGVNGMSQDEIKKEEILEVFPTVAKTIADALGCDVDDVKLTCRSSRARRRIDRLPGPRFPPGTQLQAQDPARQDRRGCSRRPVRGGIRAERHRHRGWHATPARIPERGACRPIQHADEGGRYSPAVHRGDVLQVGRTGTSSRGQCRLSGNAATAWGLARADAGTFPRFLPG